MSNSNKKIYFASVTLTLLSLSIVTSAAIVIPNKASAQEDQQQRGLLGGLEREQSGGAIPGQQPADVGGPAPLNRTLVEAGGGNQTAGGGNQTAGGGTSNTTTGPGGIGTDNPATSSDNPYSDLT